MSDLELVGHSSRSLVVAHRYLFNETDYAPAACVAVEPCERFDELEPNVAYNELVDVIRQ